MRIVIQQYRLMLMQRHELSLITDCKIAERIFIDKLLL